MKKFFVELKDKIVAFAKKSPKKFIAMTLAVVLFFGCATTLIAVLAGNKGNGMVIDNETTRLVLSTAELDGVFNPFYSSSGPDGSVVGMTQIGMLSSDKDGKVAYGEKEACVVLDYDAVTTNNLDGTPKETTYYFVLKNNIKFSDGSPLTMKDVLFNLYVYLDPAYYGSSTIYSTEIIGLEEYRTQSSNESVQDNFNSTFTSLAMDRVLRLLECLELVYEENEGTSLTDETMASELTDIMNMQMSNYDEEDEDSKAAAKKYATIMDDYDLAVKYFTEDVKTTYTYSKGTAQDISFTGKNGEKVALTTDAEAFFYNMGFISWDKDAKEFVYSLGEKCKDWTEQQCIDAILTSYVPNDMISVVAYTDTLHEYFAFLEKQAYFEGIDDSKRITSVSGIKYANRTESVTVKGTEYAVPTFNADGSVASGYEVLQITINKVDPKAIWNFAFTVAPMYYYSNQEQIDLFDYESHFGVEFGSVEFQDTVIKNPDKIGVPVGAGPYKATTRSGDSSNVTAGTFNADNVVYFERNDHFMFDVKIKYVNYQVVSTNLMLEALYSGEVHFVEPACKQENVASIAARAKDGFASTDMMTNGYGYIGINAEFVPDINVRRAIMHAINTDYAVDYYFGYSKPITRPMTKASWAYPKNVDDQGQYYKFDETGATSEALVIEAGYTKNADGIYTKNGQTLKYIFTLAGDTTDHPAYASLKRAAEILNKIGFDIEVKTDINALKKLNSGDLAVWAAAWGAGVDPDMYQVYHKDSTAGSTSNWGYDAILSPTNANKYKEELRIINELSDYIDYARETLDEGRRITYYAHALDLVMELAVELPTYQRSDLFAYNTNIIDVNTLTPASELTPYNGPMSRIWEVGLNETNKD